MSWRPDVLAFEALYQREYAGAVRLAFTLTGRADLAEELAQDTFLACVRHGTTSRATRTPRGGSVGSRPTTVSRVDDDISLRFGYSSSCVVSDHAARRLPNRRTALWDAVRHLPKRQAQVPALAFVEDLVVGQIAATLGIGEESVRTHLRRGHAAIASRLEEERENG